jgi:uncharacterized protein (UPF0303 family)
VPVVDDLKIIGQQETELIFDRFDEDLAFEIGTHMRQLAKGFGQGAAVGVYLWDRTMFFGATAGATEGNRGWVERKAKLVRLMHKSSYRVVLERGDQPRVLSNWAIDIADYAIAGGAFPIRIRNVGIIGAAATSGLPERDDHEVSRGAIALALGKDDAYLALPKV